MIITNWQYTKEEWKCFRRIQEKKMSFFKRWISWIDPSRMSPPVISITADSMSIDGRQIRFETDRNSIVDVYS